MLTVPEAARRASRDPETIRRWIRSGRLRAVKVGTQHVIKEHDLDATLDDVEVLPLPEAWAARPDGTQTVELVKAVLRSRAGH